MLWLRDHIGHKKNSFEQYQVRYVQLEIFSSNIQNINPNENVVNYLMFLTDSLSIKVTSASMIDLTFFSLRS